METKRPQQKESKGAKFTPHSIPVMDLSANYGNNRCSDMSRNF